MNQETIWAIVRKNAEIGSTHFYHRVYLSWDMPDWADGMTPKEAAESFLGSTLNGIFEAVELAPKR